MKLEARLSVDSPWVRLHTYCFNSLASSVLSLIFFTLFYFLLALLSLQLDQSVTGLSRIWLPSGLALFAVLLGGYRLAVVPVIGVLLLQPHLGWPLQTALWAALGAGLAVWMPALLLWALRFDPRLERIRDVMLFVTLGAVIGPLFSASLGTLGMLYSGSVLSADRASVALVWWLGSSAGCLVMGGLLMIWATARVPLPPRSRVFLYSLLAAVVLVSILSVFELSLGQPSLLRFIIVALIVLAATYCGQQGTTLLSFGLALATLLTIYQVPESRYAAQMVGQFSIDVALIWLATFTGLVVAAAYSEQGARAEYAYQARHDGLTRLINRNGFEERLARAIWAAKADGETQSHALMFIDLDDFKRINDRFGHAGGDQVLRRLSWLMLSQVRSRDTVARLGGDEFVVLLENCDAECAGQMAERLADAVRRLSIPLGETACRVTVSIGLVPINAGSGSPEEVLAAADEAHYRAKGEGKNKVYRLQPDEA